MDARIQAAIDEITATKSIEEASAAALSLQTKQIADLNVKVEALTAQVAAGGSVSADDMIRNAFAVGERAAQAAPTA